MYLDEEQGIDSEIAKLFATDSKEKKMVGRGASAKASRKKGFKGAVKFQYEYLTAKEKKEYMKAGEVEVYSLLDKYKSLDDVPKTIEEIDALGYNTARQLLIKIRTFTSVAKLASHLGVEKKTVYSRLIHKYDLPTREVHNSSKETLKNNDIEEYNNQLYLQQIQILQQQQHILAKEAVPSEGYTINLKGIYQESDLIKRIGNMKLMFDETKNYKININITEIIEGQEK